MSHQNSTHCDIMAEMCENQWLPTAHGGRAVVRIRDRRQQAFYTQMPHTRTQTGDTRVSHDGAVCINLILSYLRKDHAETLEFKQFRFINHNFFYQMRFQLSLVFCCPGPCFDNKADQIKHRGHLSATVMILTDHKSVGMA